MTRLVLHIGWPKTGTSTIQSFCHANRRKLIKNGVLYPRSLLQGVGHHHFPAALMEDHQKKGRRDLPDTKDLNIDSIADKLLRECRKNAGVHTIIVSSERFMTLERDQIESIRDTFSDLDHQVIFYLRRQDLFAKSIYAQNLRVLRSVRAEDILRHNILQYRRRLTRWERCFDSSKLMLVPFEPSQWENGLELDFLQRLGINPSSDYAVQPPQNERLSWAALAYLNEHLKPEFGSQRYWRSIKILDKYSQQYPGDKRQDSPYSPQKRLELLEAFNADNEYLSNTYNNGVPVFTEPVPDINQPWQPFQGLSDDQRRRLDLLFGRFS